MSECPAKQDSNRGAACLIQITDCHLPANPGIRLSGWDNWASLQAVLEDVRQNHPGLGGILLTGDLVHDESEAGYVRLAGLMQTFDVPVFAIPGNHDNPERLRSAFQALQPNPESGKIGGWRLLLLNSHMEGSDCGALGQAQIDRLSDTLAQTPDTPTLVALHHPPTPVGSAWIDALGLLDAAHLLRATSQHPQIKAVLCGHVHQASETNVDSQRILTTPATTRQFLPKCRSFAVDNTRAPGYRCLYLYPDGRFDTYVHRVPGARAAQA